MAKEFNITGTCIPDKHYMADVSAKLKEIIILVEKGNYFTINRPRQYGKTTIQYLLGKELNKREDFIAVRLSFEGVGDKIFENEDIFCPKILNFIADNIELSFPALSTFVKSLITEVNSIGNLSKAISEFVKKANKKMVIIIDEVDKNSNNQLFLNFLGMLRNKYLSAAEGSDFTFHSVILAGVHDVKTLKIKLRPGDEQKYNSPWNIATDFKVDMSFNPQEISTMLIDYSKEKNIEMDIMKIAERIYHYTSGYPFLVSRICKEIDESILPEKEKIEWSVSDVDKSVKTITNEQNTNFESLVKNIENNKELIDFVTDLVLGRRSYQYTINDPLINLASVYGIIAERDRKVIIHNKIYNEVITDYLVSKNYRLGVMDFKIDVVQSSYIKPNGKLNFEKVLLKFQEVIKEKYSQSDVLKSDEFLEKELRMFFFVFLKPIINGIGFSFKEVETSEEKRIDVIIIFQDEKFVVELKIWRGMEYHKEGISRLKIYMEKEGVQKGYMLIIDKKRHKEFIVEEEEGLMMVWI